MKEMLDHLDENGKVLGEIDYKLAHSTGAWHKSVHIYLVNKKGELLMQKRADNKDIYPSVWDISVGGHVDAGEPTITTAQRELHEELGIQADESEFKYLFTYKEILKCGKYISSEFVDVFLIVKDVEIKDMKIQECEVTDIKYVKLQDFYDMVREKSKDLLPHYDGFKKVIPILKKLKF